MLSFREYRAQLTEAVAFTFNRTQFASLPWNWGALQTSKVVNAVYYYPAGTQHLSDAQFSLIMLPNLQKIPGNQLSMMNRDSKKRVPQNAFLNMLRNPKTWNDEQINQFYTGIQSLSKTPEEFGGKDIRPAAATTPVTGVPAAIAGPATTSPLLGPPT